jgi:ABC-2 type transport system permease protein
MSGLARAGGVPRAVLRGARLTWFLGGVSLHRLTEYRADFLIGVSSFAIRLALQAAVVGIVFLHVPTVGGWDYYQVLFLLGYSLIPRGLDHTFTDQLWEVGRKLVQRGEFYRYLIRPLNPLYLVLSERFLYPDGIGELLTGIILAGYAAAHLDLHLTAARGAIAAGLVLCGATIYTSVKLILAAAAFWTTTSLSAMAAANDVADFARYPLDIYRGSLRWLLTWLLPYAFTSYLPASYLLFGRARYLGWTPLVAAVAFALAYLVWSRGIDRYETTGS